ncbi:MAG: SMP-30/gluconolactonase/LRE family protein [Pirellulales bacterium]
MKIRIASLLLALASALFLADTLVTAAEPIADIGPTGEIKKLHGDFKFTEGPAADSRGNIYFTDIPDSLVYRWSTDGKLSVFRKESNRSNGLMFNADGELFSCEMAGRIVAVAADGQTVRVLADKYDGKPFNAPNDLVLDKSGGVYFTDPHFGAATPLPQGERAVYYVADGKVTRLTDDLPAPNGVILSPDEKTLYIVPSLSSEVLSYSVMAPGKLGPSRVFASLKQPEGKENTGGDGLTVDTNGNLYITSGLGIQVFTPAGKLLGVIAFPEQPANVTFGGPDGKTLFVTARTSLYSAPMSAQGHVFTGATEK